MDRRAVWLVLGVAVMAVATTAHFYSTGAALLWIRLASLVIVGGALAALIKSSANVGSETRPEITSDLSKFLRTYHVWAVAYFLSGLMIFFGLWVLNDLYLSPKSQTFSHAMSEPAIASLVLGLALFALSKHKTRD